MYHTIITNLTTSPIMMASNIMRIRPIRSAPLPPMPNYPPPRLSSASSASSSSDYASSDSSHYASSHYASSSSSFEEDEEEQLMQINCPSLQMLIEINKTTSSLNVIINEDYKYSILRFPSLTFQDVYDSILIHFPALNELKFKLKWHENMERVSSIRVSSIRVSSIRVSSKQFMKMPIDKLPLSCGEIVDKKIHKCNLCRTESIHITQKCGACRKVYYCSESCQKLNWPYHKMKCTIDRID